jgi:hypothetical protein
MLALELRRAPKNRGLSSHTGYWSASLKGPAQISAEGTTGSRNKSTIPVDASE